MAESGAITIDKGFGTSTFVHDTTIVRLILAAGLASTMSMSIYRSFPDKDVVNNV